MQPTRRVSSPTTFSPAVVAFLQRPLAAQLATLNPSGSPHQTIMWFRYEAGDFLFTITTDRVKFRNYQHDPRASLAIVAPENMWQWVIVNGRLSVDDRDPLAFYRSLAEHYLDEQKLAEWRRTAVLERRTVLRLTPRRRRAMGFPDT
jgi:PPOX class probable F420-dependent enzyme